MKSIFKFILFIFYSTIIFFLPNNKWIIVFGIINLLLNIINIKNIKKVFTNTFNLFPFILLTFIINIILDNFAYALWICIKLILVCNITFIYSSTSTILDIANTIEILCSPLKLFKIDTTQIKIMVCISLSMIPILKSELSEIKNACKAKNISFNLKYIKYILSKFFLSLIKRINQIEESLISKGYNY